MISAEHIRAFETLANERPDATGICVAAAAARAGDASAIVPLAAAFVHCAFAAPETARGVYAAFRAGWLGDGETGPISAAPPAPLSNAFWEAFWALFSDSAQGANPLEVTGHVIALGALTDPSLLARAEAVARIHPKAANAAMRTAPPRLVLGDLACQPEGSLGHDFWRLIVENNFDLEVLDREAMGLSTLPPALRYLNTRILQMHDVWHLVGPFGTTALHEVAISAFQQAQFGHGYSAMFLAVVVSTLAFRGGEGAAVLLQTIAEASRHGEGSPSFMAIAWEEEWARPIAEIRARHGITPFQGTYPADLFERPRAA
jgi:ubiquinone biosynthesis protein Coq4